MTGLACAKIIGMHRIGSLEILGFVVRREGVEQFGELGGGLHVFYGRNGAGKTQILKSVQEIFGIDPPESQFTNLKLIVKLIDGGCLRSGDELFLGTQGRAFLGQFMGGQELYWGDRTGWRVPEEEDFEVYRDNLAVIMSHDAQEGDPWADEGAYDEQFALAKEIVEDQLFVISRPNKRIVIEPIFEANIDKPTFQKISETGFEWEYIPGTRWIYSGFQYFVDEGDFGVQVFRSKQSLDEGTTEIQDITLQIFADLGQNIKSTDEETEEGPFHHLEERLQFQTTIDLQWKYLNLFLRMRPEQKWLDFEKDGSVAQDSFALEVCQFLENKANDVYARLILDGPHLHLLVPHAENILHENVRWVARPDSSGENLELTDLSEAELKWAIVSIQLALMPSPCGFMTLDEPEAALHRSAESHIAAELEKIAREKNMCVIAASHSPEFLNLDEAIVRMVRHPQQQSQGEALMQEVTDLDREELQEFGLLPSDLLRRQKGFLLVEGQHDLLVWQALLGDELKSRRIEILPLRGAAKLKSTLDSRVLFDFTDSHVFPVLDALRAEVVDDAWTDAKATKESDGLDAAIALVLNAFKSLKEDEARLMESFMTRALEMGRENRLSPQGLSAPDVLDYLPVASFVPEAESWESLRAELEASKGSAPSGNEFKKWMQTAKKADLSDAAIQRAAESCDYIPEDFSKVLSRMDEVLQSKV